jgi:WD40 repeat protein
VSSDPADPNAPTRTVLPAASDAATDDGGDPERTRSSGDQTHASAVAGTPRSGADKARRPAPLQYRDPDRYEVIAEHGRGGLGRVMRARDKELGRSVAIKEMLHPGLTSELRFFREALITARLEHPGIVPVHEAGRWPDGTPFYAMKLVAGRPLKALIDEATTLDARLALLPHVIAVCDAVAYAHSRGIIHRDLKPSNVIVGDFGETVVIDWGLAKDIAEPDDPSSPAGHSSAPGLTMAGTVLGTPGYMPPEQAAGSADARSDIYSIGALLAHVVHGHAPEGASGSTALPPAERSSTKVPSALLAIVGKATAATPADRYATARALGEDLRHYQSGRLVTAHRYSLAQLVQHWASHNRKLMVIAFAAMAAVTTVLIISAKRIVDERDRAERARGAAVAGQEALILSHARHALVRDPTIALLWVNQYGGADRIAAQDIAAEAIGRGVARFGASEHTRAVTRIGETGDHSFVSSSTDGTLRRWRIADGRLAAEVIHDSTDDRGTFSIDVARQRLAFVTQRGDVELRDGNGSARTLYRVDASMHWLEFAPDGGRLLVVLSSGKVVVLGLDATTEPRVLQPAGAPFVAMAWTHNGTRISGVTLGGHHQAWDTETWAALPSTTFSDFLTADVKADVVVVVHKSGAATIRPGADEEAVRHPLPAGCGTPRISPSLGQVAFHCRERVVVLDVRSGGVVFDQGFSAEVSLIRFSADGRWLAFGAVDGSVHVVSALTWSSKRFIGHTSAVNSRVAFLNDAVVSGDDSGDVRIWPLEPPLPQARVPGNDLRRVAASHDGKWFATDSSTGVVRLWSSDGRLVREFRGHEGVVPNVSFSDDDAFIVTPGWDRTVRLSPVQGDESQLVLRGHTAKVMAAVARNGVIASIGHDGKLLFWNPVAGTFEILHEDKDGYVRMDVAGPYVAAGGGTGEVHEWSSITSELRVVARHHRQVDVVEFSPDGQWLVTGDLGGQVQVRHRPSERTVATLELQSSFIVASISGDSTLLALAGEDGQVRLFSLASGYVTPAGIRAAGVKRMTFAATGRRLAAICQDGMVRVWDFALGASAAFSMPPGSPIGITFTADGLGVAATNMDSLAIFNDVHAHMVPMAVGPIIAAAISDFDAPRRFPIEDKLLLFPEEKNPGR